MTNLSFSGGGWNTHTALSATFSTALQKLRGDTQASANFGDLFGPTSSISANSGGAWFLGMLAYSQYFEDDLADQSDGWFEAGYMGQMDQIFDQGRRNMMINKDEVISLLRDNYSSKLVDTMQAALQEDYSREEMKELFSGSHSRRFVYQALRRSQSKGDKDIHYGRLLLGKKLWTDLADQPAGPAKNALEEVVYMLGLARLARETNFSWNTLNHELTFQPYGMNDELKDIRLSSDTNSWATDKSLFIASTLISEPSALTANLSSVDADIKAGQTQFGATPFLLTSYPKNETTQNLDSLPAGDFQLNYSRRGGSSHLNNRQDLSKNFGANVPVLDATAASSAAIGMFASLANTYPKFLKKNGDIMASLLRNFAVAGYFPDGQDELSMLLGKNPRSKNVDLDQLSSDRYVRLADGAYLDNTSAAYQLSALQQSGVADGFELTLFVNSSSDGLPVADLLKAINANESDIGVGKEYSFSTSLAELFGYVHDPEFDYSNPTTSFEESIVPGISYRRMATNIFDPSAFAGEVPDWTFEGGKDTLINYWTLNVETVDNATMGIKGGFSGSIKVFENITPSSSSAPYTKDILSGYENLFDATQQAYSSDEGWSHLKDALGLA